MPRPAENSIPRLALGCRLVGGDMLLVPEGAIRLHGPARQIIAHCDGERTFAEIVSALQQHFSDGDPARIAQDTATFLERLHDRQVVSF